MPARDRHHNQVRNALTKEGWVITHDPLHLKWGKKDMYVDLGAEFLIAAEKDKRKIAVEVKSFVSQSEMEDLEQAVGQFTIYYEVLAQLEPDRELYLAVSEEVYVNVFDEPIGKLLAESGRILLIVFDPQSETIKQWPQRNPTAS